MSHINNESENSCCDSAAWEAQETGPQQPVKNLEWSCSDIQIPAGQPAHDSGSSVWGKKWLLPSVSWPRQVDSSSSSSRSPAPSKTSGLAGPRDGGPLVWVCSIFTTATFPCASACRQKKQILLKKKILGILEIFIPDEHRNLNCWNRKSQE